MSSTTINLTNTPVDIAIENGNTVTVNPISVPVDVTISNVGTTGAQGPTGGAANINNGTINDLVYFAATGNTVSPLATANNGILITSSAGVPSIGTALPNGVTATTQSPGDNSTKVATTAYVAAATPTFATIGSGTNTTAAMVVSTGASLAASGSGTIVATSTTGNAATVTTINGQIANGTNTTVSGSGTSGSPYEVSVATATSSALGVVQPDGTIITVSSGQITVPKASSSAFGVVEVDGTSITASSGIITAKYGLVTALGIGSFIIGTANQASAAGTNFAASNVTSQAIGSVAGTFNSAGTDTGADSLSGSWKILQTVANANQVVIFQRYA